MSYWQNIWVEQLAIGQATDYSAETVAKGGHVRVGHSWYEVARVNKKTVSVIVDRFLSGKARTLTYPYAKIRGYRAPAETTHTK